MGLTGVFRLVPADRPWQRRRELVRDAPAARRARRVALDLARRARVPARAARRSRSSSICRSRSSPNPSRCTSSGIGAAITPDRRGRRAAGSGGAGTGAPRRSPLAVAVVLVGGPRLVRRGHARHHARLRTVRTDRPLARRPRPRRGDRCRRSCASTWRSSASPAPLRRVSLEPARRAVAGDASASTGARRRPDGVGYMWMFGTARRDSRARERAQRHDPAAPPDRVVPRTGARPHRRRRPSGRRPRARHIRSGGCRRCPCAPADVPRWSGMHRIRITIDHAWRPSEVIPGSTDERVLGLQIGELTVR